MCYYNGQKVTKNEFIELTRLSKAVSKYSFLDRELSNGFDYALNTVLVPTAQKTDFEIVQMEWGFIPSYHQTRDDVQKMRMGYKKPNGEFQKALVTLNARSEELLKPGKMFRNAALHRRCLVLSTGFYEWRHIYGTNKKTGLPLKSKTTYPYYITLKDHEYFYMAGIWQPWTDRSTGEIVNSFAVVTTEANSIMAQVHNSQNRMPTILTDELAYEWMFGELCETRISELAKTQYPSDAMTAYTIRRDFRTEVHPMEPFVYADLAPLEL